MKNRGPIVAAIVLGILLVAATFAAAATTVNLAWDANTEPDLAGYKLYQGPNCAAIVVGQAPVQTILKPATTASVLGLADGPFAWKLTAYDTVGNESGFSNCVTFQADSTPPAVPGLRIVSTVVTN